MLLPKWDSRLLAAADGAALTLAVPPAEAKPLRGRLVVRPEGAYAELATSERLPMRGLGNLTVATSIGLVECTATFQAVDSTRVRLVSCGRVQLAQRRDQFRFQVALPVALWPASGRLINGRVEGMTVDVSLGGACLRTRAKLPVGSRWTIELPVGSHGPISLEVEVRWTHPAEDLDDFDCGLRWVEMSSSARERLQEFLLSRLRETAEETDVKAGVALRLEWAERLVTDLSALIREAQRDPLRLDEALQAVQLIRAELHQWHQDLVPAPCCGAEPQAWSGGA